MDKKKKRGCNYTAEEKDMVLVLVKKHQHIIENKETNSQMIEKKRRAWAIICQQFNAVAVSGSRNWTQLRHLYENLKQRSKKIARKDIAQINRLQFYEKLKKKAAFLGENKNEVMERINCNGNEAFKSSLEQDAPISPMDNPEAQPLESSFEDPALYLGDVEIHVEHETKVGTWEYNGTNVKNEVQYAAVDSKPGALTSDEETDGQHSAFDTKPCNCTTSSSGQTETQHTSADEPYSQQREESLKDQYYKAKLKNAKLEHNYLINKRKMEVNKYRIEMEILKLRLRKLKSLKP